MSYEPRKAAQLIAYLILRSGTLQMSVLKAVKLVYLVDRESFRRFGFPVLDEKRVSMPHGPVNSSTLNYISGMSRGTETDWNKFLTDREGNSVGLATPALLIDDLDELSEGDIECAEAVIAKFGNMTAWQLRDWTHVETNVPEWTDPQGGALPISDYDILKTLDVRDAGSFVEVATALRGIENTLKSARVH